jgi:hypothetical protein
MPIKREIECSNKVRFGCRIEARVCTDDESDLNGGGADM